MEKKKIANESDKGYSINFQILSNQPNPLMKLKTGQSKIN